MKIYIKKATTNDIEVLTNLEYDIWRSTYRGILPDRYLDDLNKKHIQEKFSLRLCDVNIDVYLININNLEVGYFVLQYSDHILEVKKLYILEGYQNIGIGSSVADYIKTKAIEHNIEVVESWIIENNHISESFHKKLGFTKTDISVPLPAFNNVLKNKYIKILTSIDNQIQ